MTTNTEIVGFTRKDAAILIALFAIYMFCSIASDIFEGLDRNECNKNGGMYIERQCIAANVIPLDKN